MGNPNKIIVYSLKKVNFWFTKSFVKAKRKLKYYIEKANKLIMIYIDSLIDEILDCLLVMMSLIMLVVIVVMLWSSLNEIIVIQ